MFKFKIADAGKISRFIIANDESIKEDEVE